ncbi:hypothetical protein DEIPH_ctg051orf0067 [Deinococcus phoenicis]|uniref:Uncharacterized protein n=1 Tax=Deinococcus phoenicis TaxID=1476583 RepID=A0A016QMQ3_9DEIO|nr:hypothetical protein [Deinococcus phoenicis]EYB67152.1 hypothetical protein DEIPH_ctg051orf0067 [Deinococcus phoenicis]
MSDPAFLAGLVPLFGGAFVAGAVTQLARQLARPAPPRARVVIARATCAGIAALTVAALLTVVVRPVPAAALLLAAACVTGWSGPGILTRLGTLVERKLGLPGDPQREWRGNERHRTHPAGPDGHTEA